MSKYFDEEAEPIAREDLDRRIMKDVERPAPRVPMSEQEKAIVDLVDTAQILVGMLKPVLTPSDPTETTASDGPVALQSPLASTIADNNASIRRVTQLLRRTMDRLEV